MSLAKIAQTLSASKIEVGEFDLMTKSKLSRGASAQSKFGGRPYIEKGFDWPLCKNCKTHMTFIGQISSQEFEKIKIHAGQGWLYCIYFCYDCYKPRTGMHPWHLQIFEKPAANKCAKISTPLGINEIAQRNVAFKKSLRYPSANNLDELKSAETIRLHLEYEEKADNVVISNAVQLLSPIKIDCRSTIGGYAMHGKYNLTDTCHECKATMQMVFQIVGKDFLFLRWDLSTVAYLMQCPSHPKRTTLKIIEDRFN